MHLLQNICQPNRSDVSKTQDYSEGMRSSDTDRTPVCSHRTKCTWDSRRTAHTSSCWSRAYCMAPTATNMTKHSYATKFQRGGKRKHHLLAIKNLYTPGRGPYTFHLSHLRKVLLHFPHSPPNPYSYPAPARTARRLFLAAISRRWSGGD